MASCRSILERVLYLLLVVVGGVFVQKGDMITLLKGIQVSVRLEQLACGKF